MEAKWPPMSERGPAITPSAIAALEAKLGEKLPEDYAEFLLSINGGMTARSSRVFTIRFKSGKTHDTVLSGLDSVDDPDDRGDLATHCERTRRFLPPEALPIGNDGFSGTIVLVVAGPRRGEVWFFDAVDPRPDEANPRVEWFDRGDVAKIASSFQEFMAALRPLTE